MQANEFQKEIIKFVNRWDKVRKVKPSKDETFFHIVEEIGEIARQYVNRESRKTKYNEEELKNAIGDTLMQIVKLADLYGLNIEELITKTIKEEEPLLQEKEKQIQ